MLMTWEGKRFQYVEKLEGELTTQPDPSHSTHTSVYICGRFVGDFQFIVTHCCQKYLHGYCLSEEKQWVR